MAAATTLLATGATVTPEKHYNHAIGYLRGLIVALVIAHHAALAYHPFAPNPAASLVTQPRWWQAFPVVDTERWTGFTLFVGFNDTFFMSLMFFVSGLFVWEGLRRKGSWLFLRDRLRRLGVPFIAAAAILSPLAYYPAYLQTPGAGFSGFLEQWLALGQWPAGPAWFVVILLAFNGLAAMLFVAFPRLGDVLSRVAGGASRRPAAFFFLVTAGSALVYVPMALTFSPVAWTAFGPFAFQISRILHYLVYFLIGAGIGAHGHERGLLADDGNLSRHWPLWVAASIVVFVSASVVTLIGISAHAQSTLWAAGMNLGFVFSCAASVLACLALSVRFLKSRTRILGSLSANSYAIYLLHYAFVSWLQYALLPASIPALIKGAAVTVGALALSWTTGAAIRRIPAVKRVV